MVVKSATIQNIAKYVNSRDAPAGADERSGSSSETSGRPSSGTSGPPPPARSLSEGESSVSSATDRESNREGIWMFFLPTAIFGRPRLREYISHRQHDAKRSREKKAPPPWRGRGLQETVRRSGFNLHRLPGDDVNVLGVKRLSIRLTQFDVVRAGL